MPVSVDQFGKALVASALLSADTVKEFWNSLPAEGRPKNGDALAQLLVDRGKLTAFQAKEILAGRGARLILGDYVVLQEIGAGGMGQVYKARHRRMDRVVALKVMSAAAMKDEASVKRFQREVRAAAKLEHPNIVTAYDSGEAGSVNYLVMQFVDGGDLSSLVKHNGPLPIERAVDYVIQAARGLSFAHGEGVIHRDIKPANLLVDKKGVVKILDMGLARIESNDDGLTATEQVMGTVDYMSPEQAANTKGADARADIYSLGCTLWFLLTGKKLYDGDTMISRLMAHRDGPLPSLVKARDDAQWPLEQAFHKMIAKRVDDRFQTMDEAIAALAPFAGGDSSSSHGGSNVGIGSQTNAELAAFLQHVGPQTSTGGTGFGTTKTATGPQSSPMAGFDATASFVRAEEATDPKSQVLSSKQLSPKSVVRGTTSTKPPIKLIAAGLAVAALIAFGIFWATRKDPGETVMAPNTSFGPVSPIKSPTPSGTVPSSSQSQAASSAGYALEFDGQGYLQSKGWEDHALEPPLTIEGLFKLSERQPVSGQPPLLFFHGQFGLKFNTAGNRAILEFGNHQSATLPYYRHQTESVIEPNRPVHLAVVWTPGNLLLFNDGRLTGSHTVPAFTTRTVLNHFISAGSFVGSVDEIRISRAARYEKDFQPQSRFEPDPQTLALYHCDDGVGGLLTDASPNRMHGEIQAGKWVKGSLVAPPRAASPTSMFESPPSSAIVPAPGDYALKFDGYSVVEFQEIIDYSPHSCTIEAYVRPDAYVPRSTVFSFGGQNGLGLDFSDGKHWQMSHVMSQGGHYHSRSSKAAELGKRVHIAGVCDQSEFRLYVDGKLSGSSANGATSFAVAKNRPLIGSQFQGVIDEIRISKTPRYSSDFSPVARHKSDADTLALYHFDEVAGNVLNDASGNNFHGWVDRAKWVRADGTVIISPSTTPVLTALPKDYLLDLSGSKGVWLDAPSIDCNQPFTMEFTATPQRLPTEAIAGGWNHPLTQLGWGSVYVKMVSHPTNQDRHFFVAVLHHDNKELTTIDICPAVVNRLTRIAVVGDGREVRFFVDGKLLRRDPIKSPIRQTNGHGVGSLHGAKSNNWVSFPGLIDEVRYSKVARYDTDYVPQTQLESDSATTLLYHFDEGSGELIRDASGNGNDGEIVGAKWVRTNGDATATPAPTRYALQFDGASSVETPDIPWGGLNEMTSEAWVRAEDEPPKDGFLVDRFKATNLTRYQGRWQFTVKYAGEEFPGFAAQPVAGPIGRWEHVAGVLKDGKSYLFVDGKPAGSKTLEKPIDLGQGHKLSLGTRLKASIRAVRVSKTARYLAEFTPSAELAADPETLLLYRFDEGAGDVLHDRSGHGLDGKIIGAKWVPADEKSAAAPTAPAPGGEIDLLAGLDVVGNAVAGKIALDAGGLRVTDGTQNARIHLPTNNLPTLPAEYDLKIRVQRIGDGGKAFGIGFVRPGEQGMIIADGYSNPTAWALEMVDGRSARDSKTLVPGDRLSDKAPHEITVRVRNDGITALCDDVMVIDWKGAHGRLTPAGMWQVPRKDQLIVGFQGPYAVHAARLKPIGKPQTAAAGEQSLFSGNDLTGWEGDTEIWQVVGGELVGTLPPGKHVYLARKKPIRDFEASFEVKLTPGANSGMQFRSTFDPTPPTMMIGPQAEVGGDGKTGYAGLWHQDRTGRVEQAVDPAVFQPLVKPDDYNAMTVRCVGKHVTITLNGKTTVDADFDVLEEGLLGWQLVSRTLSAEVRVRNARIREIGAGDGRGSVGSAVQEIDLVDLCNLDQDRVSLPQFTGANNWTKSAGTLKYASDGRNGKLVLPVDLVDARDWEVAGEVRRLSGSGAFTFDFAPGPGKWSGLDLFVGGRIELKVDGNRRQPIGSWPATSPQGGKLQVRVRRADSGDKGSVIVHVDGVEVARWEGDLAMIGGPAESHPRYPGTLNLGLFCRDSFEFANFRLRVIDGNAQVLRN